MYQKVCVLLTIGWGRKSLNLQLSGQRITSTFGMRLFFCKLRFINDIV